LKGNAAFIFVQRKRAKGEKRQEKERMLNMLKYTGERVIPELMKPTNGMLLEHVARYYFSTPYVHG
jgi:hypothetical protein